MKQKILTMILSLVLVSAMFAGCQSAQPQTTPAPATAAADTATAPATTAAADTTAPADSPEAATAESPSPSSAEPVTLTIFAHAAVIDTPGIQTDPVAQYIKDKLNITLNFVDSNADASVESERLSAYMASNDMPDIFVCPTQDLLQSGIDSKQVLNLDSIWNSANAPNMTGGNPDAASRQKFFADHFFNGQHNAVLLWGGTGGSAPPTVGFAVPWEYYKSAGYPQANNLDDLVNAVKAVTGQYPQTPDGQKVYGVGMWAAEGLGWGDWMVSLIQNAWGYQPDVNFVYTFDMSTNDLMDKPLITQPDSPWWQSVEFMYKMNKAGLIDPDSTTQKYDQWQEKAYSGRYALIVPGWEISTVNQKTGLSYVALKPFPGTNMVVDWSGVLTGSIHAISSNCKNPDKALQLLDWLWSPEGARMVHSGIQGKSWDMVDGHPEFTDQFLSDRSTMSASQLYQTYGANKYPHFVGYASNVISPSDNSYFDLTMTPYYTNKTNTPAMQDALSYYKVSSFYDIYRNNVKDNYVFKMGEYNQYMPVPPDDIQKNATDLGNYVYRNYLNCVFAKDDADFQAQKQAIIDGAAQYNISGVFDWYKTNFTQVKAMLDPYLNK